MLIEGKNGVREALNSNTLITKLFIDKNYSTRKDEIISLAVQKKVKIDYLPKQVLDKKSKTSHHQGYIAEVSDYVYSSVDDILKVSADKNQMPFVVILDGIEDPHNFGAIIRSCECAGVDGIIIAKDRCVCVNETVMRTSTGACNNMKIARVTNLKNAVDYLKSKDIWVMAAETGGEDIYKCNLNLPLALVIGSEGKGIKKTLLGYCDKIVSLPLRGSVNSLNASVACGIAIFEALRQRNER